MQVELTEAGQWHEVPEASQPEVRFKVFLMKFFSLKIIKC